MSKLEFVYKNSTDLLRLVKINIDCSFIRCHLIPNEVICQYTTLLLTDRH